MKRLEVRLSPETIALLDRFRKRHGLSRPEALRKILHHEIKRGSIAKTLKAAGKGGGA